MWGWGPCGRPPCPCLIGSPFWPLPVPQTGFPTPTGGHKGPYTCPPDRMLHPAPLPPLRELSNVLTFSLSFALRLMPRGRPLEHQGTLCKNPLCIPPNVHMPPDHALQPGEATTQISI